MTERKAGRRKPGGGQGEVGGGILGSLTDFMETLGELTSAGEQRPGRGGGRSEEKGGPAEAHAAGNRFGQILDGLANIAEKLNEISEKGETLSKEGKFTFPSKEGGVKGVYGFSFRTGLGGREDDQIRVEPFGNIRKDKKTGEAVVQEISEPLVDVFEDEDSTTLVAEMPGVGQEDISIDVRDDILTIQAQKGEKKYRKEILLGHRTTREGLEVACNNGVVTIRCEKAG